MPAQRQGRANRQALCEEAVEKEHKCPLGQLLTPASVGAKSGSVRRGAFAKSLLLSAAGSQASTPMLTPMMNQLGSTFFKDMKSTTTKYSDQQQAVSHELRDSDVDIPDERFAEILDGSYIKKIEEQQSQKQKLKNLVKIKQNICREV